MAFHGYLSVQSRGVVALPADLRRRLGLDEPGAQLEVTEREDGVLEMRPSLREVRNNTGARRCRFA